MMRDMRHWPRSGTRSASSRRSASKRRSGSLTPAAASGASRIRACRPRMRRSVGHAERLHLAAQRHGSSRQPSGSARTHRLAGSPATIAAAHCCALTPKAYAMLPMRALPVHREERSACGRFGEIFAQLTERRVRRRGGGCAQGGERGLHQKYGMRYPRKISRRAYGRRPVRPRRGSAVWASPRQAVIAG